MKEILLVLFVLFYQDLLAWRVYGDLLFIQNTSSKEPFMIIINEPLVSKTFELLFDEIWESLPEF